MTFESIPGLLADLLQEQRGTRGAITSLAEAIAGIRVKTGATPALNQVAAAPAVAPTAEAPATSAAVEPNVESASEAPSYQLVANAITSLSKTKGRIVAMELLKTFGISKLPEAKPDQYATILAAASQAALV